MNCELMRQQLIDLAYGEGTETAELNEHLASCETCAAFYVTLKQTQELLGPLELPDESGFRSVRHAVVKAAAASERRRLVRDLVLFVMMMMLVFGFYFKIYQWQGLTGLLYLFLGMYLICPVVAITLRKRQVAREGGK